jgi:hypothetical protein
MRASVALQRILSKQIQACLPAADTTDTRRCAAHVVRAVKIALQLDDAELDGLMHGSMAPRPLMRDETVTRRMVRTVRRH